MSMYIPWQNQVLWTVLWHSLLSSPYFRADLFIFCRPLCQVPLFSLSTDLHYSFICLNSIFLAKFVIKRKVKYGTEETKFLFNIGKGGYQYNSCMFPPLPLMGVYQYFCSFEAVFEFILVLRWLLACLFCSLLGTATYCGLFLIDKGMCVAYYCLLCTYFLSTW